MSYRLVDKEAVKTYLFSKLSTGEVEPIENQAITITLEGVKYMFDSKFNLRELAPIQKYARVLTKDGLITWSDPAKAIYRDGKIEYVSLEYSNGAVFICSNYVCLDKTPDNPMKITKDNLVIVDENLSVVAPDIEEKDEKLIVKNEVERLMFGVLDKNSVYLMTIHYKVENVDKLEITKGTCLGDTKVVEIDLSGHVKREYPRGTMYFCY